jgi:hypothetical protein
MRRWPLPLLAALLAIGCGSRKPARDTAASDALWELAPAGARYAVVVSPAGVAAIWSAVPQLVALLDSPDLAELKPRLEQLLAVALAQPTRSMSDSGLALDRGFASFATADGKTIVILPVADRDKWVASRGGTLGSDGDHIGDRTCRQVHGVYACTTAPALLDQLGSGPLVSKLASVGERGDFELWAGDVAPFVAEKGELAVIARLDHGSVDLRGRWRGKPDGIAALLADTAAPRLDPAGASGFARANVAPLLGDAGDTPIAGGVTTRTFAKSLRGPIRVAVPAGSVDLQVHAPLVDPAQAAALIEHCDDLPIPRAATATPGACRLEVPFGTPLELDAWIENSELRVASHKGPEVRGDRAALTAVGRELALGDWSLAFWGRGTMLNAATMAPATGPLPPPAARAIHLMALVDELGAGISFDRDGFRFRLYARTVFENPPEIAGKLAAIDGNAIASGRSTALAKALAVAGSPFAVDFRIGQGGLMIPAAIASSIAALVAERVAPSDPPGAPEGAVASDAPGPPMDRVQLARLLLIIYRDDAIPKWRAAHGSKACPATLEELAAYLHGPPDVPTLVDPWGNRLIVRCNAKTLEVVSAGPDGKADSADDVHP